MNSVDKYVVSSTLTEADLTWAPTTLVAPDKLLATVQDLRSRPGGDVNVMGSLTLARWLMENDLVDEVRLMVEPILLGGGKRLFPDDGNARPFELVETTTARTGVLICRYRRT
jgi:dihydrofolate reductase